MGLDLTTYAMIVEELSRGWISISGVINTHFIGSYLLHEVRHRRAEAEVPAADGDRRDPRRVLALRARAGLRRPGDQDVAPRSRRRRTTRSTARRCGSPTACAPALVFVLVKTDPDADPRHKGMTCFIAEKEPGASENTGDYAGLTVPPKIKKMGYKGVESTELVFDGYRCPAENILGGEEAGLNKGFAQMMDALEVGRVNVAARGVGIAQRALELALRYSQERKTFGKPIAQHQAIQFKLADMATQVDAARLLTLRAAPAEGRRRALGPRGRHGQAVRLGGRRASASRSRFRIHGGYGYSKEYEIERLYRDAPLLLIGEGTSEIQKMVIGKKLLAAPQDLAAARPPPAASSGRSSRYMNPNVHRWRAGGELTCASRFSAARGSSGRRRSGTCSPRATRWRSATPGRTSRPSSARRSSTCTPRATSCSRPAGWCRSGAPRRCSTPSAAEPRPRRRAARAVRRAGGGGATRRGQLDGRLPLLRRRRDRRWQRRHARAARAASVARGRLRCCATGRTPRRAPPTTAACTTTSRWRPRFTTPGA